ncbi:MAG: hypothetical protein NVV73_21250 [Cellvibrionaceae bacterium]|nr:hypothetical protein [Cellvibrionaceae bacterium]
MNLFLAPGPHGRAVNLQCQWRNVVAQLAIEKFQHDFLRNVRFVAVGVQHVGIVCFHTPEV